MAPLRILPIFFLSLRALAMAPSGEEWLTISSPHFRVHHTPPLEGYARRLTLAFESALPELEHRMSWKLPAPLDVIVMDPSDSANGLAVSFPNTHIELFSAPFPQDSPLAYYHDWESELAIHELTHIIANDTTLGFYRTLRSIFGSWVKPNGIQPVWLSEGLGVFQETSLSRGGRGRSPLLEALLREAYRKQRLDHPDYISIDRFNDSVPWWPAGNTPYLLGYTIQALPAKELENFPGRFSFENGGTVIFAPNRGAKSLVGKEWAEIWAGAGKRLAPRFDRAAGRELDCRLTDSGRHTGGQALSPDGWVYFSEEDFDNGTHLARVRADAPCGQAGVERLDRKRYSGPGQVAVSPSGRQVAFAKFDPGPETLYSDLYLWTEKSGTKRLSTDLRARDPAFLDEQHLLYVRTNPDVSSSIVERDLKSGKERVLFSCRSGERIASLSSRNGRILFSLHGNRGREKIHELREGAARPLVATMHPSREFERNPFPAADGSVYFSASYGSSVQEIYRLPPGSQQPQAVLSAASGFLDRPLLLDDGQLLIQSYGLNGLDLARAPADPSSHPDAPAQDLHELLSGERPRDLSPRNVPLSPSVPYSIAGSGTSLWPQYWFPELAGADHGFLAGASSSGNDALNYHRYFLSAQYDSRARFPVFRSYYRNRSALTNFHFEAVQTNNYFLSSRSSNRNTTYSVEAIFPLWDFSLAFGTAYRERRLFGSSSSNVFVFQNLAIDRSGKTPAAISPNWGASFSNFTSLFPSSRSETSFFDLRPELQIYFPGLLSSHSISLGAAAGISTNRYLASNYYQGGGPSPLSSSPFVVRGYPGDTLFGQRIVTANIAYTLPLAHVSHGLGTNPIFIDSIGLRFLGDAGTAKYMAVYSGGEFQYYEFGTLGSRYIYGFGADLVTSGSLFYHVPVSVITGVHRGTQKRFGGELVYYFSIGFGLDRGTLRVNGAAASHLLQKANPEPGLSP